jgi:hypothetical protein
MGPLREEQSQNHWDYCRGGVRSGISGFENDYTRFLAQVSPLFGSTSWLTQRPGL